MSRIFPSKEYNLYESLDDPRSKSEWGYGVEKIDDKDFLNFLDFLKELDQKLDSDFKIWIGIDAYDMRKFSEICVFDQKNGNFHLIEYFPFKYQEKITYRFNQDSLNRGHLIKERCIDIGENSPKLISDNPVERLKKFSQSLIEAIPFKKMRDSHAFKKDHIHKHFFFASLKKGQGEEYFITTEKEKKTHASAKAYDYGKNINYYSKDELNNLIEFVNKPIKNALWKNDFIKDVEYLCLPVIKEVETKVKPKELSELQLKHVNRKKFSSIMRLKGVAGSGKTFVLTNRVIRLVNEDKRVLMTYYTISFKSYLKHLMQNPITAYKTRVGKHNKPSILITHVHQLMRDMLRTYYDYLSENGLTDYEGVHYLKRNVKPEKQENYEIAFAAKILKIIKEDKEIFFKALDESKEDFSFDAIVVDEGQNFKKQWFRVLREVALRNKPEDQAVGDMMVAFDEKQRLFANQSSESAADILNEPQSIEDPLIATYRVPQKLFEKINIVRHKLGLKVIEYYAPTDKELGGISEGEYEWINLPGGLNTVDEKINFVTEQVFKTIKDRKLKVGDSCILVDDHAILARVQDIADQKAKKYLREEITDHSEILDIGKNYQTCLLKEHGSSTELHDLILKWNDWKSFDLHSKTWNSNKKQRSFKALDNLLFHLYDNKEDLEEAIAIQQNEQPDYTWVVKLDKKSLEKLKKSNQSISYVKAYDFNKTELDTKEITSAATEKNRALKLGYHFSDSKSIITHTVKSFQGQELPNVFIFLSGNFDEITSKEDNWEKSYAYEVYVNQLFVALTRSRRSAWILNPSKKLNHIEKEFNRD